MLISLIFLLSKSYLLLGDLMQLIINCPTDEIGIKEFNNVFADVQKELILYCIRKLNVDVFTREKILNNIVIELKKKVDIKDL